MVRATIRASTLSALLLDVLVFVAQLPTMKEERLVASIGRTKASCVFSEQRPVALEPCLENRAVEVVAHSFLSSKSLSPAVQTYTINNITFSSSAVKGL